MRDSLEESHEETEVQRKALRREKDLAFGEDTCLEKKRVRSKVIPRKVGMGLKWMGALNKRRWNWRFVWCGSVEKEEASRFFGLRGRNQYSDQRFSRIRVPSVASTTAEIERRRME